MGKQSATPLRPGTDNKMAYQPNVSSRLQCRSPQASTDHYYDGTHGPFRSWMCLIKQFIYAMYCLDSCVPSKCEPVYSLPDVRQSLDLGFNIGPLLAACPVYASIYKTIYNNIQLASAVISSRFPFSPCKRL